MGYGGDGFVLRAIGAVLGDLADIGGYEARWVTVAAADVGAPHRRERVFILASAADAEHAGSRREADDARGREPNSSGRSWRGQSEGLGATSSGRSHPLVDAPNSARIGSDGGLPESAGIVGRPDAAVSGDEPGRVELLPTPCVVDRLASGEMTLDEWDESRKSQKERGVGSFGPRGDSLGAAVLRVEEGSERPDYSTTKARRGDEPGVALLPTPVSAVRDRTLTEVTGRMATRSIGSANLDEVVIRDFHSSLLPTPRTSDTNGAGHHGDGGMDLRTTVSLLPTPTCEPQTGNGHARNLGHEVKPAQWGKYAPAIARWESLTRTAPAPTEPNKNGNPRLSAAFSEWLMGWPDGWVTDPAIGISRNDQLRIVGNGVCSQQAAAALRYLLAVAMGGNPHNPAVTSPSLLPTPCARDYKDGEFRASHARNTPSLGAISAYFNEVGE